MSVAGQVMLEGDGVYGIRGVLGMPLLVSHQGVVRVLAPPVWQEEARALHEAAAAISEKIARWTEGGLMDTPNPPDKWIFQLKLRNRAGVLSR